MPRIVVKLHIGNALRAAYVAMLADNNYHSCSCCVVVLSIVCCCFDSIQHPLTALYRVCHLLMFPRNYGDLSTIFL